MAYLQKRTNSLTAAITGKSEVQVAASYTVLVAKQGATVKTAGAASPIAVDDVGQFATNDKFIVNNDTAKYRTVSSVDTSAKTIAYSGAAISVSTQDRLINLGADLGVDEPAYGAGLTIYSDIAGNETATNPVTTDSSGNYSYWIAYGTKADELIRNSSGTPVSNLQDIFQTVTYYPIGTLANDATPSILGGNYWLTGGTTTITDFDDGVTGQIITVISEHTITITDGTNIFLSGSANWTMAATDTLTLICKADNKWYEVSRTPNVVTETATGTFTLNPSVATEINSSGGAVTGTLGNGKHTGQFKTIVMTDATNSSTVSITNHETSDPEVATFDAVDETLVLVWTGTEWATIKATCTFV